MAVEIVWSTRAEKGFDKIVHYIAKHWTDKEVSRFIREAHDFFELLKRNPKMLQPSPKTNLYRGPMNKLTMITYRIDVMKNQILLINVRSSKQRSLK